MNNDYLWDKTGSDAEIEGLENTLSRFRYAEVDQPELPATNIIEFAKTPHRRWFAYLFAAAACLTLVMLAGVWLPSGETGKDIAKSEVTAAPAVKKDIAPMSNTPASKAPEQPDSSISTAVAFSPIVRPLATRSNHRGRRKQRPLVLTAKERYAYGQLMLALSITGSKLRIVREMIDGPESKHAIVVVDK